MAIVPSYQMFFFLIFLNGVTYINKVYISYAHFVDNLGSKRSAKFTSWLFFIDSTILVWTPLAFMTVTKNA